MAYVACFAKSIAFKKFIVLILVSNNNVMTVALYKLRLVTLVNVRVDKFG